MTNICQQDVYYSTKETARILGVSLGTVQNMVEKGVLTAWRTEGGHRRVSMQSIQVYLQQRPPVFQGAPAFLTLKVLVIEDDPSLQEQFNRIIQSWNLPVELQIIRNGCEGMVQIGLDQPDIIVINLMLLSLDGFEVIRALSSKPELHRMNIIVISHLTKEEIVTRGGLPKSVTVYSKPVPFDELRGYLQAVVAQRIHFAGVCVKI